MPSNSIQSVEFTLIYDTYCGWCYGAADIIEALCASDARIKVLHRALFQGAGTQRMGDGFGQIAQQHDQRIASLTGKEFSPLYTRNILRSADEILDSDMTARAAALLHSCGAQAEMSLAHQLQKARYIDGISAADPEPVITALGRFFPDTDKTLLLQQLNAAATAVQAEKTATQAAIIQHQHGIQGVPMLLRTEHGRSEIVQLSRFYNAPEAICGLIN